MSAIILLGIVPWIILPAAVFLTAVETKPPQSTEQVSHAK